MLNWREIPFIRLLLPFMLGLSLAFIYEQPIAKLSICLLFLFLLLSILSFLRIKYRHRWFFGTLLFLFFIGFGYQMAIQFNELQQKEHFQKYINQQDIILVQVIDFPKPGKKIRVKSKILGIQTAEQQWKNCTGNILLYLETSAEYPHLRYGDQVLLKSKINPIPIPKNPEAFDFQAYQHFQNTHYQLFAKSQNWKIVQRDQGLWLWSKAYALRSHFLRTLKKHLPSDREYGVAAALILGSKNALTPEIRRAYSSTGATHVLAVSGLHVGFIYLGLATFLGFFRGQGKAWKIIKTLLLIAGVWAYAFVTGAPPSVLRAATMFSFIIMGRTFNRNTNIYNTLALSAFCLLCYQPYLLAEVGFQLSYLAVLGIVSFQPWIYRLWIIDNPIGDNIWKLTSVGIAAQLATFPITIFYFHQFPLYFWLSGLIVVPAAMFVLGGGLLLFFLESTFTFFASSIGFLLYALIWMMNALIHFIEQLPAALIQGIWIGRSGMIWLYLGLLFLSYIFWKGKRFRALAFVFCLAVFFGANAWQNYKRLQQKEIIVYHIYGNSLVDLVDGRKLISLQPPDLEEKKILFAAQNYRWKSGVKEQQKIALETGESQGQHWWYQDGFLQFYDKRILLLDKAFHSNSEKKVSLDYLILSKNPKIELEQLHRSFPEASWIADASNAPWKVSDWQQQCKIRGIDFIDISKEGAWIIPLK